jgi:hypothetical protein
MEATNNTEGRAHRPWKPNARALDWTPLTREELRSYLAIHIYISLHFEPRIEAY